MLRVRVLREGVEGCDDAARPKLLAPFERPARVIEAQLHCDVDVVRICDSLLDCECSFIDEAAHYAFQDRLVGLGTGRLRAGFNLAATLVLVEASPGLAPEATVGDHLDLDFVRLPARRVPL